MRSIFGSIAVTAASLILLGMTPKVEAANFSVITYKMKAPVMLGPVNLYYIWYGQFSDLQKQIIVDYGNNIDSTPWFNVLKNFYFQATADSPRVHVSGPVRVIAQINDTKYSYGQVLNKTSIEGMVLDSVTSGRFPADPYGFYSIFHDNATSQIMDSPDDKSCGWHSAFPFNSTLNLIYQISGNPKGCADQFNTSNTPNGDYWADGTVGTFAHEVF